MGVQALKERKAQSLAKGQDLILLGLADDVGGWTGREKIKLGVRKLGVHS